MVMKNVHLRAALGVGGLKAITLPLTILLSVVLARVLGPESFGRYAFVMSIAIFLALPAGVGVNGLLVREVARAKADNDHALMSGLIRRTLLWVGTYSVLLWAAVAVFWIAGGELITGSADMSVLFALGVFPLLSLIAVQSGILQGLQRPVISQSTQLLFQPTFSILLVGLLVTFQGALSLNATYLLRIIAVAFALLAGIGLAYRRIPAEVWTALPKYEDKAWRQALLPFILIAATNTLNVEIGILVLGGLGAEIEVGALRVAQSGAQLLMFPLFISNMIMAPFAAGLVKTGDLAGLQSKVRRASFLTFFVSACAALPLILFAAPILGLIFGEAYAGIAELPLQVLALGFLFRVACGPNAMILSMAGHEQRALRGQIVTLVVSVTAVLFLSPMFGSTGAAAGISLGLAVGQIYLLMLCHEYLHFLPIGFWKSGLIANIQKRPARE
ncbi:oligosaccharide flippase family protein [Aliiroseovarius sp. KMU-50]|uniref:Oligosaccharide flippase family protein n=1 Tax=Aliiroseovarius salicola TaxID=3009082 RepID=A0ABT4VXU5_9RHOB|nr:oligosaccharide flippase family protein [Aliiroseovarius sp. KMU-50]MDA5093067.1 oligosaccharide flippase family protein [Aliiroseovarius sp. KMU-50]